MSRREKYVDEEQARKASANPAIIREVYKESREIREQIHEALEPTTRITQKDLDFIVR